MLAEGQRLIADGSSIGLDHFRLTFEREPTNSTSATPSARDSAVSKRIGQTPFNPFFEHEPIHDDLDLVFS
jgi:hypothetical protein